MKKQFYGFVGDKQCEEDCRGWDGEEGHCDFGARRVYWDCEQQNCRCKKETCPTVNMPTL